MGPTHRLLHWGNTPMLFKLHVSLPACQLLPLLGTAVNRSLTHPCIGTILLLGTARHALACTSTL